MKITLGDSLIAHSYKKDIEKIENIDDELPSVIDKITSEIDTKIKNITYLEGFLFSSDIGDIEGGCVPLTCWRRKNQ